MFLTKNLHPKKITIWAELSVQGLIGLIFIEKNVDGLVYRKILKKEAFPQLTVMKRFSKFWFQQDGAKTHTADLTLDLVETYFKKRFHSKKWGTGAGRCTAWSQSFVLFPLGLCKGPVLRKQPENGFGSAEKYHQYFQLTSRRSGHFIVGYPELPEAFGVNCGEGGWTHRKRYN